MTPDQLRDARATLGQMYGLERPLNLTEMGRALRLRGRDIAQSVRNWERGHTPISGPLSIAVEAMLAGFTPTPTPKTQIQKRRRIQIDLSQS